MIHEPFVKDQVERKYYGIRFVAPYRGMFKRAAEEFKNLERWIKGKGIADAGPRFLRYLVIDMSGDMELEIGVFAQWSSANAGTVSTGVMPAGRYATLIYKGLGLAANKALIGWIERQGLKSDRTDMAKGDSFACRYEAYLTDPSLEPRKKQWDIELAIKLKT
jgi:effector-binding domain-containing protein